MADAQASGACGSNIVRVQVPFSALQKRSNPKDLISFFIQLFSSLSRKENL